MLARASITGSGTLSSSNGDGSNPPAVSGPNSRELQSSAFDPNQIPEVAAPCQPVLHKGYNAGRSSFCVSKGTAKHAERILLLRILALVMEAFR